jgi:hypothetical protein
VAAAKRTDGANPATSYEELMTPIMAIYIRRATDRKYARMRDVDASIFDTL